MPNLCSRHRMNPIIERMDVLPSTKRKVPCYRLPQLHIFYNSVRHLEIDPMRAVRLLDGIPPLLTMRVDPTPLRIGRAAKGNVSAGNFQPMAREGLNKIPSL